MKSYCFYIILLLSLLSTSWCMGQDNRVPSEEGYFTVDFVKGCSPLSVEVRYNNPPSEIKQIRFEENVPFSTELTHTYETPGTYKIEALFGESPNVIRDFLSVTVKEPIQPDFKVYNCGNRKVQVEILAATDDYDYYELSSDEGGSQVVEAPYVAELPFNSAGLHTISVKGFYSGNGVNNENCNPAPKEVFIQEEIEPAQITSITARQTDNSIEIFHSLQQDVKYSLEYQTNGDGSYETYPLEIRDQESLLNDLNPKDNFYCFRIRTDVLCGGSPSYTEPICTARLQLSANAKGNQISFETAAEGSLEKASLLRKAEDEVNWQQIDSFDQATAGSYLDSLIECNTLYQYAVRLDYAGGFSSLTESLPIRNDNQRSLTAPSNIISEWLDASTVEFSLPELRNMAGINLKAFRADNPSSLVNEADTNFIMLPAAAENTCYRFQYADNCGNASALSVPVCAIYLKNSSTQPGELFLEWNAYEGYAEGLDNYVLVKYDQQGNVESRTTLGLETQLDLGKQDVEQSGVRYQIVANPLELSFQPSTSNLFIFEIAMKGYFPNAFTPNGDEQNDNFTVIGEFVTELHLQIFNRWGELVYETANKEVGWDGTVNGSLAPPGAYRYRATVTTVDGQKQSHLGAVFLIGR